MKRYIKSFTTDQLKQQLGDNYPEGGYLYIFKHGIGPGTIPKDVQVVKTKDLPNYYTAVWLDRFLTTPELKQYDIPDETRINELLGRIGYCQKNGDVVPCDDVEACDKVTASRTINRWNRDIEEYEPVEIPDDWNVKMYSEDMDEIINCPNCGKEFPYGEGYTSRRYHNKYGMGYMECEDCYEEQLKDEFGNKDVNACGAVEASSSKYFANMVSASEHPNTYGYMVSGYYDSDRRGLAESEWTEDLATVDELANEYANKGYYIVVNNFETGTVLEFSADNWFDEIYPDGLSGVEGLI